MVTARSTVDDAAPKERLDMMTKTQLLVAVTVCGLGLGLVRLAFAEGRERRGPPPEAIAACAELEEGDECTVKFGEKTLEGTCKAGPSDDDPLACMPEGGRPMGPPPEALEACADLEVGDACTVELHDRSITGTCREGRGDDEGLVCMPDRPPQR